MARFEVTEANWVRATGLATLGAAEASLEATKRADIVMVGDWGGRRIYNEERRGNTRRSHTRDWRRLALGEEIRKRKESVRRERRKQRGLVWKNCGA